MWEEVRTPRGRGVIDFDLPDLGILLRGAAKLEVPAASGFGSETSPPIEDRRTLSRAPRRLLSCCSDDAVRTRLAFLVVRSAITARCDTCSPVNKISKSKHKRLLDTLTLKVLSVFHEICSLSVGDPTDISAEFETLLRPSRSKQFSSDVVFRIKSNMFRIT